MGGPSLPSRDGLGAVAGGGCRASRVVPASAPESAHVAHAASGSPGGRGREHISKRGTGACDPAPPPPASPRRVPEKDSLGPSALH